MSVAAGLLAAALLVVPAPAQSRLGVAARSGMASPRTLRWLGVLVVVGGAVMLLPLSIVLALSIVTATISVHRRGSARVARRGTETTALRDALDILTGELRVGAHPVAAFEAAAGEVGGKVGGWLRTVAARGRLGGDVSAGIRTVGRASANPAHWDRLAVCWRLAHSHGLAVATLMHTAHHDIVERERFAARVDAGLAGARTTATVLAGMPVLGIGLGQLIGADPLVFLLSGGTGGVLLVVGVGLSCLGLLWSDRIVTGLPT